MEPIAITTGSGISVEGLLDSVEKEVRFSDVCGLRAGTVAGHRHVFVHGRSGNAPVILQSGRLHLYEGFSYEEATRTVDWLHSCGVRKIVFINAAGALDPAMAPGDLLAVDRVRLWRYARWDATPGFAFPDLVADGCDWTGTLQWVPGPSYETRAEIAALQSAGAAAVGMSTGPEVVRCQELGLSAMVISCITNCCYKPQVLTHEEVLRVAHCATEKMSGVLRNVLAQLVVS